MIFNPPPERGRVAAEGGRVGVRTRLVTPTRFAPLTDLPLAGAGKKEPKGPQPQWPA
jgi:hypothetical protein